MELKNEESFMSTKEMKLLVSELVEEKLIELLGDPEVDLELKEEVAKRLRDSLDSEKKSDIETPADKFAKKLGLKW